MNQSDVAMMLWLDGKPLEDDIAKKALAATVDLAVGIPGEFEIVFNDPQLEITASKTFKLGDELEVEFRDTVPSGPEGARLTSYKKVLTAEITEIHAMPGGYPRLTIRGYDLSHRMQHGTVNTTYTAMTDRDIVQQIVGRHGLSLKTSSSRMSTSHDYLLQACSDFEMLNARAADLGLTWRMDGKNVEFLEMPIGDRVDLQWGADLMEFSVRATAGPTADTATVQYWDAESQAALSEEASIRQKPADIGTDAAAVRAMFTGSMSSFAGDVFEGTSRPQDAEEAKALAKAIAGRAAAQQFSGEGETAGSPRLRPAGEAELKGVDALDGVYQVVSVTHHYLADESFTTRFAVGTAPRTGLADLLDRPASGQEQWSRTGLVVGTVTSIKDPERYGRVRVKFPTLGEKDESSWARVISPGAGPDRGMALTPEIDDEVIVGFEHGDTRSPFVLGGVWSAKNKQPTGIIDAITDEEILARTWRSRLGHEITLLDGDDDAKQAIVLALSDGKTRIHIGVDEVTIDAPTNITVKGDKNIKFEATENFEVKANNIKFVAQQAAALEGSTIKIDGKQEIKSAAPTYAVDAKAKLDLTSSGVAALKGSMVNIN